MDEKIKELQKALEELNIQDLFAPPSKKYDGVLSSCASILRYSGYTVLDPPEYASNDVKNIDSLIHAFYRLVSTHYKKTVIRQDLSRDRRTAKLFVDKRQKVSGVSRKIALGECYAIILTIFNNLGFFNFNRTPDFNMFFYKKMSWVVDKAVDIMNEDYKKAMSDKHERRIEAANNNYEGPTSEEDLNDLLGL